MAIVRGEQPIVSLYTDNQVADMRRFCCGDNNSFRSVVGIDRTFNLGPCFVTVTVYTNHSVVRTDSCTSPTFVGLMYLHWDGKYQTYVDIFTDLRSALEGGVHTTELRVSENVVVGSDEEKALTKALREVFRDATYLLCVKHLKDNATDYMRNKCGVQQTVRTRLIERMFGEAGILNANDSVDFERQANDLAGECQRVSAQLGELFARHIRPAIQKCIFEPRQQNKWLRRRWNNNACESINHVLKLSVNWRPRRLPDLVEFLHKVVEMQMADLRRALHSQGNFRVTPPFGNFVIDNSVWQSMSAEDKDAHVASFVAYRPRQAATSTTVTSTNGVLTVPV